MSLARSGLAWLLVAEAGYAVMRVATRAGAGDLHWAQIAAARFLGGACIAVLAARASGRSLRVSDPRGAWLRSLFGTGGALALFHALGTQALTVGDATTLYATTPLWVALLAGPLLGERVTPVVWAGVALGFAGVAVLMGADLSRVGPTGALVLLGAVSYALAVLRLRRLSQAESSEAIALHMSLTAGGVFLLLALPHLEPVAPAAYIPLAVSAIAGGVGQVAVGRAYAREGAAKLSAVGFIGVVFTYLLDAALFGATPTPRRLAGAGMVVAAGVGVALWGRPRPGREPGALSDGSPR